MQLTTFEVYEPPRSNGLVIIELGSRPDSRAPLNCIRKAAKALGRGLQVGDIEGGANVAICLLQLTHQTVSEQGWLANVGEIRTAVLQLRKCALTAAKSARGVPAKIVQDVIEGVEDTLLRLDAEHAS
jgi:hypothetical protein